MNTTGLTDDEMRVRIAEACGWTTRLAWRYGQRITELIEPNGSALSWDDGESTLYDWLEIDYTDGQHIPDYLNDLNAMHEAEKRLTPPQWSEYAASLEMITRRDPSERLSEIWRTLNPSRVIDVCLIQATARQRALAFLAMLPEPEAGR